MNKQEVLEKIAYDYYEKFKSTGMQDDPKRNWMWAEKVYRHFTTPPEQADWKWRLNNEDFKRFERYFE